MKHHYLKYVGIIMLAFFITSCKRTFTCECQSATSIVPIKITHTTKELAKKQCEQYNYSTYAQTGGCQLK